MERSNLGSEAARISGRVLISPVTAVPAMKCVQPDEGVGCGERCGVCSARRSCAGSDRCCRDEDWRSEDECACRQCNHDGDAHAFLLSRIYSRL